MSFADILRNRADKVWEDCYAHPFVQELGTGKLSKDSFKFYLKQDYVYLLEYAKVFAMGAVKSRSESTMTNFTVMQHSILYTEMEIHRSYMKDFGISLQEAETTRPSLFNRAYTSNMLTVAQTGDVADILAVILPCAWSYYDYSSRLAKDFSDNLQGNFYRSWIESYSSKEYYASILWLFDEIEALCADKSESEKDHLSEVFNTSIEFEYLFWDMAYKGQMSY